MSKQTLQEAVASHQAGRFADAEKLYREFLQHDPRHPDALHLLGVALAQQGKADEAIEALQVAVDLRPDLPQYRLSLIQALIDAGRSPAVVVGACEDAITIRSAPPEFFAHIGQMLCSMAHAQLDAGQSDEALGALRSALKAEPSNAAAWNDLGAMLRDRGELDEAVTCLRRATELAPQVSETRNNLGNALKDLGLAEQAIAEFRRAIELRADNAVAHSNLLFTLHLAPSATRQTIADEHRLWGNRHADPLTRTAPPPGRRAADPQGRLRLGYVSPDFHDHPVGRFVLPLLKHHDRAAFDVTCYSSYRGGDDEITRELRACADSWRSVAAMSDEQLAKQIRGDQIDILIDLAGHSASNRLLTFARRPAPVQMTYLGYPDTTGMAGMDFRLTDAHADPPGAEDGTERLIRLQRTAWCFGAPAGSPEVSTAPHSGITFGSFNNLWKLNDDVLRLWARVLDAAEGSRLIIKAAGLGNESAQQRIISVFQACGVEAVRIELRPPVPRFADHLAACADIDIALDAWPYHGMTTTCEALWMGAPVATLAGDVHASRVGVSLLTNAGLPELIAKNADDYVATAAALAADRGRNRDLRTTLRQRMLASPLMDATRFARDVETALRDAWMQKQA